VDNAVNVGVGLEHLVKGILLGDIELNELGLLAADKLNTVQSLGRGVVQVVSNDDLVAGLEKGKGGERANVARATAGELVFNCINRCQYVIWRHTQQQELNQKA
jgi:hypothetical protein